MGYAFCLAPCVRCKQPFSFNPHKVPSIRVPPPDGPKQPLCRSCVEVLQEVRKQQGLEPWPDPLPGAYELLPEEEL